MSLFALRGESRVSLLQNLNSPTNADTLNADTLDADTLNADTHNVDPLTADILNADTLNADTLIADTLTGMLTCSEFKPARPIPI